MSHILFSFTPLFLSKFMDDFGSQGFVSYKNAPLLLVLVFLCIILFLASFFIVLSAKRRKEKQVFFKQLDASDISSNVVVSQTKRKGLLEKWNWAWTDLLKNSDFIKPDVPAKNVGLGLLGISFFIFVFGSLLFGSPAFGIIILILFLVALKLIAKEKIKKKKETLEDQIPAFIETLKSNIQGNMLPEQALILAIDQCKEPLYSELKIAKQVSSTASFSLALSRLRQETSSAELRFLCSCIELSARLGANLESQLDIIEHMIAEQKEIKVMLNKAIAENTPLRVISAIILPALFGLTYVLNESTRNFWFKEPISFVVFFGILAIFGGGQFLAGRLIKRLDDLR